jgi:hypothetical protein
MRWMTTVNTSPTTTKITPITLAAPIWFAWNPRMYMSNEDAGGIGRTALGQDPDQVEYTSEPTSIRVEEVMIVYFSCGRVMEKKLSDPPCPIDLGGFIHLFGDLPYATLVEGSSPYRGRSGRT